MPDNFIVLTAEDGSQVAVNLRAVCSIEPAAGDQETCKTLLRITLEAGDYIGVQEPISEILRRLAMLGATRP